MARIPLVDPDDPGTDPETRRVLELSVSSSGQSSGHGPPQLFNVLRAMANHPQLLAGLHLMSAAVQELSPAQKELAYLTAALTNDCFY